MAVIEKLGTPEESGDLDRARQRQKAIELHGAHFLRMERVADFVRQITRGYEEAVDPKVLDEKVAKIKSNSTLPLPPNIRAVAETTQNVMTHNIERQLYEKEFPGHDVPPMPDYLRKV